MFYICPHIDISLLQRKQPIKNQSFFYTVCARDRKMKAKQLRKKTHEVRSRELTWSICVILLKDRSSQARSDGSARKWLTVLWRSQRSVMLLLLRRREQLRYFLSEFLFKGLRPVLGSSVNASKSSYKTNIGNL